LEEECRLSHFGFRFRFHSNGREHRDATIKSILKTNAGKILQRTYEIFCAACCIGMLSFSKDAGIWVMLILSLPFAFIAFLENEKLKKISFGIFFGLLSYGAWTLVITAWTTDLLDAAFGLPEHSWWDVCAFLLPVIFAITTSIWAIRKRKVSDKFDRTYLSVITAILFICGMCQGW
jgi:hypothetical protein